jgi:hypothetical protein
LHRETLATFRSLLKDKMLTRKQINDELGYKNSASLIYRMKQKGLIAPVGVGVISKNNQQLYTWIGD